MLLGHLDKSTINTESDGKCPKWTLVPSSVIRKLPSVELKDVTTFEDLCHALLRCVSSYTHKSTKVHRILENYKVISPKSSERLRRTNSVGIPCKVLTDDQPLPDLRQFYNLTNNKKWFQNFFVKYCIAHYRCSSNTRKYPIVCHSINITFDTELWSELCASPG